MKNIKLPIALGIILLGAGCTKQPYYNIPTNNDGNVIITSVSKTTSDGITTLDGEFTVEAYFPNAKEGDTMTSELLKPQTPPDGGADQLLPLSNTQKQIILGGDLKATVSYTREDAKMKEPGDFVRVTFSGKTASGQVEVKMEQATNVSGPEYEGKEIDLMRGAGEAFFNIDAETHSGSYTGQVIVKMKNGENEPWSDVGNGSFPLPTKISISGNDFAQGKDTMFYSFVVKNGEFVDSVTQEVVVQPPAFFFAHSGFLSHTDPAFGGLNLLGDSAIQKSDVHAVLTLNKNNGALILEGGAAWSNGGKNISFVPSDQNVYDNNNSVQAIDAFNAGNPSPQAKPDENEGVYIFKIVNGSLSSDIIYGMLKVTEITPGEAVNLEYRIGNKYVHSSVIN